MQDPDIFTPISAQSIRGAASWPANPKSFAWPVVKTQRAWALARMRQLARSGGQPGQSADDQASSAMIEALAARENARHTKKKGNPKSQGGHAMAMDPGEPDADDVRANPRKAALAVIRKRRSTVAAPPQAKLGARPVPGR